MTSNAKHVRRFYEPDPVKACKDLFSEKRPNSRVWVGIDPGVSGAIAFLPEDRSITPLLLDMPIVKIAHKTTRKGKAVDGERSEFDFISIRDILDPVIDYRDMVVIGLERTQPMNRAFGQRAGRTGGSDSPKTAFSMGIGFGMWHLYFAAFNLSYETIPPQTWKRQMGLIQTKGKVDKNRSRQMAMRLYPDASHYLKAVSDDGRAEALLIAETIRRNHNGRPGA